MLVGPILSLLGQPFLCLDEIDFLPGQFIVIEEVLTVPG
jgi:hypothetical protein